MAPHHCGRCGTSRAVVKRPKDSQLLCKDCFLRVFEDEVHHTITASELFLPGDRVAIGASGGKDSTVLASVLKTLNDRYHYGLELSMLSIDEGIKGYRDDSLQTVKRNSIQYDMPLHILGYEQIYGWTMDQVVETTGRKGNCTYCGVFRRQALDRGVKLLGIAHLVTGHNADDMAETILMNLLRGDLPRLARGTRTITNTITNDIRRSKPLKYSYEKEIVLYAHHKGLDYFSTECIYSPEAFRGTARTLIKALERIRSSIILDIVRSGEDMSILVDTGIVPARRDEQMVENPRPRKTPLPHTHQMQQLADQSRADQHFAYLETDMTSFFRVPQKQGGMKTPWHDSDQTTMKPGTPTDLGIMSLQLSSAQALGSCLTCGYMSSQPICQACRLLETLNNNRAEMQLQQQVG